MSYAMNNNSYNPSLAGPYSLPYVLPQQQQPAYRPFNGFIPGSYSQSTANVGAHGSTTTFAQAIGYGAPASATGIAQSFRPQTYNPYGGMDGFNPYGGFGGYNPYQQQPPIYSPIPSYPSAAPVNPYANGGGNLGGLNILQLLQQLLGGLGQQQLPVTNPAQVAGGGIPNDLSQLLQQLLG